MSESSSRQVLKRLPLIVGVFGGSVLMVNRLAFTPDLLNSQSRADALGIALSAVLILTGLLWEQGDPPAPIPVPLEGVSGLDISQGLTASQQLELGWLSKTVLATTPARSLVMIWQSQIVLRRGILKPSPLVNPVVLGSVMQRVITTGKPVYLVDLKNYPAKQEFTALFPDNLQSVLCQAVGSQGLLLIGTDTPRSLTSRDRLWINSLAERWEYVLDPAVEALSADGTPIQS